MIILGVLLEVSQSDLPEPSGRLHVDDLFPVSKTARDVVHLPTVDTRAHARTIGDPRLHHTVHDLPLMASEHDPVLHRISDTVDLARLVGTGLRLHTGMVAGSHLPAVSTDLYQTLWAPERLTVTLTPVDRLVVYLPLDPFDTDPDSHPLLSVPGRTTMDRGNDSRLIELELLIEIEQDREAMAI